MATAGFSVTGARTGDRDPGGRACGTRRSSAENGRIKGAICSGFRAEDRAEGNENKDKESPENHSQDHDKEGKEIK